MADEVWKGETARVSYAIWVIQIEFELNTVFSFMDRRNTIVCGNWHELFNGTTTQTYQ